MLIAQTNDHFQPSGLVFERINQISSTVSLNDMAVSPDSTILAACQDRVIRSYSLSGKPLRSMKGSLSDDGNLTKVPLLCIIGYILDAVRSVSTRRAVTQLQCRVIEWCI